MQALNMESALVAKETTKWRLTTKQILVVVVGVVLVGGAFVAISDEWRRNKALESKANELHSAFSTAKMHDQKLGKFPQMDKMLTKGDSYAENPELDPELLKEFHTEVRWHEEDYKLKTSADITGHIFKAGSKSRVEVTMVMTDTHGVKWRYAVDQLTRGGKVYVYANFGRLKEHANNKVTCHVSDERKQPPAPPLRYYGSALLVDTHRAGLTGPRVVDLYQSKGKKFSEKIAFDAFGKYPVVSTRVEGLKVSLTWYKHVSSDVDAKNFVVPKHIPCKSTKQDAVGELDLSDLFSAVLF